MNSSFFECLLKQEVSVFYLSSWSLREESLGKINVANNEFIQKKILKLVFEMLTF